MLFLVHYSTVCGKKLDKKTQFFLRLKILTFRKGFVKLFAMCGRAVIRNNIVKLLTCGKKNIVKLFMDCNNKYNLIFFLNFPYKILTITFKGVLYFRIDDKIKTNKHILLTG